MIKPIRMEEDPLVKINWAKIGRYIKALLDFILAIIKETLKVIIKILTFILRSIYRTYMNLRKFCTSRIKGFWIVLLIFLFLVLSTIAVKKVFSIQNQKDQEYKRLENIKNEQIDNLLKEKKKMKQDIKDLEGKLSYQQQRQQIVATGWEKVKVLPENVKQVIAKYSAEYNVNRPLVECIVANESSGRNEAVGDSGAAIGVSQWHKGSWEFMRIKMKEEITDLRKDANESIKTMCYAIANGYISWWSAYAKCS